ncbi:MAG: GntR family transcriptional regulator [Firmicutes bacterium]|nr:GntR family transcriptional regulator [Bacillota bacterium]MBR3786128.1 GntR family transcriptional regulator [Bacillota bacterium]
MVSFEQFQMEDGSPIYLQIVSFVQRGIVAGTITDGDEMPSRRVLSALIGVNPNTIQKAYRQLEDDGIIESRSGAKSYVTITPASTRTIRGRLLSKETAALVQNMKQMGISMEEAISLVAEAWSEEE